jgi:hypothetical protein
MKLSGQLHILLADRQTREEIKNNSQLQKKSLNLGMKLMRSSKSVVYGLMITNILKMSHKLRGNSVLGAINLRKNG